MPVRKIPHLGRLLFALTALLLLLTPAFASAGSAVHAVRGHGILTNEGPSYLNELTINASVDASGAVSGFGEWNTNNLNPPDCPPGLCTGMIWRLQIDSLDVVGNVAHIHATVLRDNRFPELTGCQVEWTITDNGDGKSGALDGYRQEANPACYLGEYEGPILGGNYTVR